MYNEGSHIPEQEIPKIWQSFYKLDQARTRAFGGTGIGLSIVKAVLEAHKCQYGVRNTPDGVEFWCTLPLDTECSSQPAQPPGENPQDRTAPPPQAQDAPQDGGGQAPASL